MLSLLHSENEWFSFVKKDLCALCAIPSHARPEFAAEFYSPTPKNRGQVKMAVEGPAHGTSMGNMQALNTNSSVSGATTWFLNQRMSLRHSVQKHGSLTRGKPEVKALLL